MALTRQELLDRFRLHEDSFVERKTESYDFRPTIVAFANTVPIGRDAILFIGVRDNGEIAGVANPDSLQKKLQKICRDECYPAISFSTELLQLDEKVVIAVVVPPSSSRPHFAGHSFVREGSQNITASERALRDMIAARSSLVAELQKARNQPVTVVSHKNRLGRPEFEEFRAGTSLRGQLNERQVRIEEVNSFYVTFDNNGTRFSEPLENLTLSYDDEKRRPMIHVRFDRA